MIGLTRCIPSVMQYSINFRTNKDVPKYYASVAQQSTGRPTNEEAYFAFKHVVACLDDNYDEQITVSDLVDKMRQMCGEKAYMVYPSQSKNLKNTSVIL